MSDDLVKRLRSSTQFYHADCELKMACACRIEELEAKLAKVTAFLQDQTGAEWPYSEDAKDILAELRSDLPVDKTRESQKGGSDE